MNGRKILMILVRLLKMMLRFSVNVATVDEC